MFNIDKSVAMSHIKEVAGIGGAGKKKSTLRVHHGCSHREYIRKFFHPGGQSCYLTGDLNKVVVIHETAGDFAEVSGV